MRIAAVLIVVTLVACAGKGSSHDAKEVPLTMDQLVANHTNTVLTYRLNDGGSGQNVFDSDGGVRGTYNGKDGPETDTGRYAWERGTSTAFFGSIGGRVAGLSTGSERIGTWLTSREERSVPQSIQCNPSSTKRIA